MEFSGSNGGRRVGITKQKRRNPAITFDEGSQQYVSLTSTCIILILFVKALIHLYSLCTATGA